MRGGRAYDFPEPDTPVRMCKRVAVIGAGNTVMDTVRTGASCSTTRG